MKKKRRLLKIGAYLIFLIICTLPYLNWEKKNKISSTFREIVREMYDISLNSSYGYDSLVVIEEKVNEFTAINPVPENLILGDFVSKLNTSTTNIGGLPSAFVDKVHKIEDFYREAERRSNHIMYFFLFVAFGAFALMKHYINRMME
jgi:hypothetical protein